VRIGKDVAMPAATTSYATFTANPAAGPQSYLELIESLSNAIGVNDPLRFRSVTGPEKFQSASWSADSTGPTYANLFDGNATSSVEIITFTEYSGGITAKRFTVDLSVAFRRPNFITIQSDYGNNAFYGFSVLIEKSVDNVTFTTATNTVTVSNNEARLLAFSLGDLSDNRYIRFTFTATQAISSGGALRINRIRGYGNQYYGSTIPVYTNSSGNLFSTTSTYLATSSGEVGIGTTSAFTIGGTAELSILNSSVALSFGASNTDLSYVRRLSAGVYQWQTYNSGNTGQIHLQPYGGNVGIGTTSAGFRLQLGETVGLSTATPETINLGGTYSSTAGSNIKLRVYDDGSTRGGLNVSGGQIEVNTWSTGKIAFYRGTTQSAIINENGNLGIGTTSVDLKLTVVGDGAFLKNGSGTISAQLYLANAANNRAFNFQLNAAGTALDLWTFNSSNAWQNSISFDYNGSVGIGSTSPGYLLDVNGAARFTGNIGVGGAPAASRVLTLTSAVATDRPAIKIVNPNFYSNTSSTGRTFYRWMPIDIDGTTYWIAIYTV
jgi:hypothetical protein